MTMTYARVFSNYPKIPSTRTITPEGKHYDNPELAKNSFLNAFPYFVMEESKYLPCVFHDNRWRDSVHKILNGLRSLYKDKKENNEQEPLGKLHPKMFIVVLQLLCSCKERKNASDKQIIRTEKLREEWSKIHQADFLIAVDYCEKVFVANLDKCEQLYGHFVHLLEDAQNRKMLRSGIGSGIDRLCYLMWQAIEKNDVKLIECLKKPIEYKTEREPLEILGKDMGNFIGCNGKHLKDILSSFHNVCLHIYEEDHKVYAEIKSHTDKNVYLLKHKLHERAKNVFVQRRHHEEQERKYKEEYITGRHSDEKTNEATNKR